jgi:hypothetical protein
MSPHQSGGRHKNKIYHTVRTVPKSNRKIRKTEANSIPDYP